MTDLPAQPFGFHSSRRGLAMKVPSGGLQIWRASWYWVAENGHDSHTPM
jgi:hypothetical protein